MSINFTKGQFLQFQATTTIHLGRLERNLSNGDVVDYDGTTYRLYRDGAVIDTQTSGFNSVNISDDLHFGVYPDALTGIHTNMFLSEWQITKGTAKYAGAFTPKSAAFIT